MSTYRIKRRRRTQVGPIILIAIGLLLIALMIWQLSVRAAANFTVTIPSTATEVLRVSVADARAAVEGGQAVWIDVRDEASYTSARIPGALNIPLSQLESQLTRLDPDQWYIPYCT